MAVVLPGKFIFLATPYTGSHAVARALGRLPGAFAAFDKRRGIGHHALLSEVRQVAGARLTGTEAVIVAVRNPYDVLISWYLRNRSHYQVTHRAKQRGRDLTLRDFLELWIEAEPFPYLVRGRIFYHASEIDKRVPRFVLRHERLEAALNAALRAVSVPCVKVGRENATPGKDHWSLYYDDPTYAFVNEKFRDDFVKFGFSFRW